MANSKNALKNIKLKVLDFSPGHFERDIWTVKIIENEAIFRCTDNSFLNESLTGDETREHLPLLINQVVEIPLMLFGGKLKKFQPANDSRKDLAERGLFSYEKLDGEVNMFPSNSKWSFIGKFVKEFRTEDDCLIEVECRNIVFYLSPDGARELNTYKLGDLIEGSGFPYLNLESFVKDIRSLSYF